jgi:hypothetical protein
MYVVRLHTGMGKLHADLCRQNQAPHPEMTVTKFQHSKDTNVK